MTDTGLQPLNIFLIVFPFTLSFIIVTIRVWRKVAERRLAIEDVLLLIAQALLAVLTGTMLKYVMISYSGYHSNSIPEGAIDTHAVLFWRYINNAIYNPILGLVKISFLITLLKLRSSNRLITASIWTLIVVNILFIFAATLGSIFMCWPIHKYWVPKEHGTCGHRAQYIFGVIGITIATDVLVTIVPVWIMYGLQMSLKVKIVHITFLSLPLAVTTIGCYRLYAFIVVFSLPTLSAENPHNVRNAFSNIESNLAVIAACGPTVKWILGRFIPCFNASHAPDAYSPEASMRFVRRPREYLDSDRELEMDFREFVHDCGVDDPYFKSTCDDAESQEHIMPITRKGDV